MACMNHIMLFKYSINHCKEAGKIALAITLLAVTVSCDISAGYKKKGNSFNNDEAHMTNVRVEAICRDNGPTSNASEYLPAHLKREIGEMCRAADQGDSKVFTEDEARQLDKVSCGMYNQWGGALRFAETAGKLLPPHAATLDIPANKETGLTIPAGSKLVAISTDAFKWSHDPLASMQNLLMLPGVSFNIKVDDRTISDIEKLIRQKKIWVKEPILSKIWGEIKSEINKSLQDGMRVVSFSSDRVSEGWVVSEIWKKYLYLRNPDVELDTSYRSACGEQDDNADKSPSDNFKGSFPAMGLPIGSLLVKIRDQYRVFCRGGDEIINESDKPLNVTFLINDDQPFDNSGYVRMIYKIQKL